MGLFNVFTQEVVDLGTANTLVINNDKVVDEPSIVAMDRTTGKVIAWQEGPANAW